jgi:histidinol-phosphate/aromatic aminotransferase/cobyric acid decarboxylase-like protein/CTP:molybdopterin cytidylyltransferase MocA
VKAIILTAGFGRRMQPLSDAVHKALLPVGGSTILGRAVAALAELGVTGITVVTGYRADDIRDFFVASQSVTPVTFVHNARYAETNNIVSLSLALDGMESDEDIVLVECDLLFQPDVLKQLDATGGNAALVDRYRPGMDGTVVAVDHGVITQVYPPHLQGPDFNYADKFKTLNIYRFEGSFCRSVLQPLLNCYANLIDGNCYYELVLGMLINMQRHRIAAVPVNGSSWVEVDDPNDLAVACFRFEPETRSEVLDRSLGGYWNFDVLDFAFMRNAYFPADGMVAAMRQALPALLASYGSSQQVLNDKLAYFVRCSRDRVELLHGASQVFPILRETLAGRSVLLPAPSFGEYARMFPDASRYRDAPGVDQGALEDLAGRHDVTVIVNPNSPTGTTLPTAWIHRLAEARPQTLFVVDESFVDFSGEEPLVSHLERRPLSNVLVVMSLSKTLGVPGLRLGYVYSCDRTRVDRIAERLPIWNVGAPGEFLLELLLKYRPELDASITRTVTDREAFSNALRAVPLVETVFPSGGNFMLVRLRGGDTEMGGRIRRQLLSDWNMDVKDVSDRFDDAAAYLRVAVRRPEENARFVSALGACASAS